MLHQRKYITHTIIPQEDEDARFGKKMFPGNKEEYFYFSDNAGVHGERISELNKNSRKQISYSKSDSSQMKEALNHCTVDSIPIYPSKKTLTTYASYDNQDKYFETKLVPDSQGRMSIRVGRKNGSATVNMNIESYDLEKTYHTWKRILEKSAPHTRSNLENDRFLTVSEDAKRSDRLPDVKNRNPPIPNKDGPFESERLNVPKQARDNLDRTLTPRVPIDKDKRDVSKRVVSVFKNTFHISQPHNYDAPKVNTGVKRNVSHWAYSDRVKKILYNYSGEQSDEEDITYPYQPFSEPFNESTVGNSTKGVDYTNDLSSATISAETNGQKKIYENNNSYDLTTKKEQRNMYQNSSDPSNLQINRNGENKNGENRMGENRMGENKRYEKGEQQQQQQQLSSINNMYNRTNEEVITDSHMGCNGEHHHHNHHHNHIPPPTTTTNNNTTTNNTTNTNTTSTSLSHNNNNNNNNNNTNYS